jgi:hypothetical protein
MSNWWKIEKRKKKSALLPYDAEEDNPRSRRGIPDIIEGVRVCVNHWPRVPSITRRHHKKGEGRKGVNKE